jgi:CHASE3 domain sensor protein
MQTFSTGARSRLLIAGLMVPAISVIALALIGYLAAGEGDSAYRRVSHTYTVMAKSDAALSALLDSETSVRGYALTGQPEFLLPYESQRPELPRILDRLELLTRDNPIQQTNVIQLRALVLEKVARMATLVVLRRDSGFDAAQQHVDSGRGQTLMNGIRARIKQIKDEEMRLLTVREAKSHAYENLIQACCLGFLAASVVMVGLSVWLMVKLQRLQNLVTVCAWTQRVQYEGKWIRFEDYLWQRFQIRTTHGMSADAANKMRAELDVLSKPKTTT